MKSVLNNIWDCNLKKWYDICFNADNVVSEVLDSDEARDELSVDQMHWLLHEFGDDEFVTVDDNKQIVVIGKGEQR